MRKEAAKAFRAADVVIYRDSRWVVSSVDHRTGMLYIVEIPKVVTSFSFSRRLVASVPLATKTGERLSRFAEIPQAGAFCLVPTELAPNNPYFIAGYIESVEDGVPVVWRADGGGRIEQAGGRKIIASGLQTKPYPVPVSVRRWVLTYADCEAGRKEFARDLARYASRAVHWWQDGQPLVYDESLELLRKRWPGGTAAETRLQTTLWGGKKAT